MSTSPESDTLSRALDEALGVGPPLPPVQQHLVAGRRAVRRRRAVAGLGAAAVVAVLGTTYVVAAGGPGLVAKDGGAPIASRPSPSANPDELGATQPIGYDQSGDLVIRPGVAVLNRIDNPLPPAPGGRTAAVSLGIDGKVRYYLLEWQPATWTVGSTDRSPEFPTLQSWVDSQATNRGTVQDQTRQRGAGR